MPGPLLKTVTRLQGNNAALKDGSVQPAGFELAFEDVPVLIDGFRRMVRGLEFDVSEMALTTYVCARAHGKRFTALPIFLVRAFHHGAIQINTELGIRTPKDLEGRKVGVNRGWTVTTGLWARSVLQHQYGVDLTKITWVLSGDEHVAEYRGPANVVNIEKGKKLEDMLASGEIAAAIGLTSDHPNVAPLIADAKSAGLAALKSSGYYPINHTLVVRDELLAAKPDLAMEIFEVFAKAKRLYVERLPGIAEPTANEKRYQEVMAITGADPLPYGLAPNRKMVEMVTRFACEQGIIAQPYPPEDLFARGTHDLVA